MTKQHNDTRKRLKYLVDIVANSTVNWNPATLKREKLGFSIQDTRVGLNKSSQVKQKITNL